jgi:hypothetical protein
MNIDEALKIVRQPAGSYRYPVLQKAWVTLADEVERLRAVEAEHEQLKSALAAAWPGISAMITHAWQTIAPMVGVDPNAPRRV